MTDIGPAWLRQELPQPIAHAWHMASLAVPLDGLAAASAVEVALRFVTALQTATLVAHSRPLPRMLTDTTFSRPTLGSWVELARTLRRTVDDAFVPSLASWPDGDSEKLLREIVRTRNDLAHDAQASPGARRDLHDKLTRLAADLLVTLGWLRQLELIMFVEARPARTPRVEGRMQLFRGTDAHPSYERATWVGDVALARLYVVAADGKQLLDIDPFVRHARLKETRIDAVCLWKGIGQRRGDVIVSDDAQDLTEYAAIEDRPRLLTYERVGQASGPGDATRYERPRLTPHVAPEQAASTLSFPSVRRSRPRRWLALVLVLFLLGGAGVAAALIARSPACAYPALDGRWRFDTHILRARAGMEYGLGVRGHYQIDVGRPGECAVPASLDKSGYTQSGRLYGPEMSQSLPFTPSSSGRSIAALAQLRVHDGDTATADIALRLSRYGDYVVGLWRHEGEDWKRGGYSGAILGGREAADDPALRPQCFYDCIAECHPGRDPLDDATEDCLVDCARRLDGCPR